MLSHGQIREFYDQGFVHLPRFVKEPNALLDFLRQNQFLEPDETWYNRYEGFHPGFAPFEKLLAPISAQILGDQSHLSFIQVSNIKTNSHRWKKFHIDGQNHVTVRGQTFDKVPWFKIIMGIFVTKTEKDTGELLVAPKGHWEVEKFFQRNARRFWKDNVFVANSKDAYYELIDTIPVTMTPLYANPGDVVLFHSMMPHTVAANKGALRPVVYFRYGEYEHQGERALTSMWQGFDGLNSLLANPEFSRSPITTTQSTTQTPPILNM